MNGRERDAMVVLGATALAATVAILSFYVGLAVAIGASVGFGYLVYRAVRRDMDESEEADE